MAVDTPARIAIIGAGPIGLEAALYARYLGYEVTLFEQGDVGHHVRQWQHVEMFSPWKGLVSPLGRAAIEAQWGRLDWPEPDSIVTGRQWLESYLCKLAETDLVADSLRTETSVVAVSRSEWLRTDVNVDRRDWTLRLLVRHRDGSEQSIDADVVFDASGVLGTPGHFGPGGAPAVGEEHVAESPRLWRWLPDIGGRDRASFLGERTLVVGGGASAATAVLELVRLAREDEGTRVTWVRRSPHRPACSFALASPEDRRARLLEFMQQVQELEAVELPSLEIIGESWIEAIERCDRVWQVRFGGAHERDWSGTNVLALVGYRPDIEVHRELQISLSPVWECHEAMGRWLAESGGDRRYGADQVWRLESGEPDYYTLGAKSFGRRSDYFFLEGLLQIRDLFTRLGDRTGLDLYAGLDPDWPRGVSS